MLFYIKNQPGIYKILLFSVLFYSCTAANMCQTTSSSQPKKQLLQFMKAPCYGPCPAYQADIMDDGSITFISWGNIANVAEDDTLQFCLSKKELQQLKADLKALNYTSLQDAYLSDWSDRPSTYLTIYQDGKVVKRVKHQEGGPESLLNFQKSLDQTIMNSVKKSAQ
jgi:hypothetical protein